MRLQDCETTIQGIIDELYREPKEALKRKLVTAWRAKLEREPPRLPPFQIDQIMREVHRRLHIADR